MNLNGFLPQTGGAAFGAASKGYLLLPALRRQITYKAGQNIVKSLNEASAISHKANGEVLEGVSVPTNKTWVTVKSITGAGFLTHVVTPCNSSYSGSPAADFIDEIKITIDGTLKYHFYLDWLNNLQAKVLSNDGTKCIAFGAFKPSIVPLSGLDGSSGFGSYSDEGIASDARQNAFMLTPTQALFSGLGIRYETGFKIEMKIGKAATTDNLKWGRIGYVVDALPNLVV